MNNDARKRIKQRITAFILTFLVLAVGIMTVITSIAGGGKTEEKESPDVPDVKTEESSEGNIFEKRLFMFDGFINLYSAYEVMTGAHMFEDASYGYLIKDRQGKLHFTWKRSYKDEYGEELLSFAEKTKARGIPFIYIQAPNKKLEGYTSFPPGARNDSNEDADELIALLNGEGIETFDLRERIRDSGIAYRDMFYATDHHWTNETAFWAFGEVTGELNARFGLNIDPAGYHRNIENYDITYYPGSFLGSQGRRVGEFIAGVDDYDFIAPKDGYDFVVCDMVRRPDWPLSEGPFMDAVARQSLLKDEDVSTNRYAAYFGYDYGLMMVRNNSETNGIKLLIVKDSFALPLAAYLSTCVSEVWLLDPRDEDAPIAEDVMREHDFDAVIVMYNTEVFDDVHFDGLCAD
ncbi:MAG: hypothetical protein II705_04930 [Clostridia bacterium]|nr:hypothetical protein [Clostridia bacterium]